MGISCLMVVFFVCGWPYAIFALLHYFHNMKLVRFALPTSDVSAGNVPVDMNEMDIILNQASGSAGTFSNDSNSELNMFEDTNLAPRESVDDESPTYGHVAEDMSTDTHKWCDNKHCVQCPLYNFLENRIIMC